MTVCLTQVLEGCRTREHLRTLRRAGGWQLFLCLLGASAIALCFSASYWEATRTALLVSSIVAAKQQDAFHEPSQSTKHNSSESQVLKYYASMNCTHMPRYNYTGKTIWVPAYPGSGSEMLRALIVAVTGQGGDDFYMGGCKNSTVTCKTHWPTISHRRRRKPRRWKNQFSDQYIVLLRNPKNALPSFFNYKWEAKHHRRAHSVQGPEADWTTWRDRVFETEIENWKNLFFAWRDEEPFYKRAFFLPYEELTAIETGPRLFARVANEMRRIGVRVAAVEDIPCLWYSVVMKQKGTRTKRASHKYNPSYTSKQRESFLRMLEELKSEFLEDPLVKTLDKYHKDIRENLRVVDPLSEQA